jgi:hypothetical protein
MFAGADTQIKPAPGIHRIRILEHYGLRSPSLHVARLQSLTRGDRSIVWVGEPGGAAQDRARNLPGR